LKSDLRIYVLSYNRPEMLALCLAGVCGFNRGAGEIIVFDDGSDDVRTLSLLRTFHERNLIDHYYPMPHAGIGPLRRAMLEDFCASEADQIMQVEGDMLVAPAAIVTLAQAYREIRAAGTPVAWLCTHQHDWCHSTITRLDVAGYDIGVANSGSEPFWTAGGDYIRQNMHLLPAARPDMVLFLQRWSACTLYRPEIQVQHLGAIDSYYYPQWTPEMVTYRNADGSMRQPYPDVIELDFSFTRELYSALYRAYYDVLRRRWRPVELPTWKEATGETD